MVDMNPTDSYIVESRCELVGLCHPSMSDTHHGSVRTINYEAEVGAFDLQEPNEWLHIVMDVAKEEFVR